MIAELLKKWEELEPSRCCKTRLVYAIQANGAGYGIKLTDSAIDWDDRQILQGAIQDAIVDRDLRVKIENESDGWYVTLSVKTDSLDDTLTPTFDPELSIALLSAYVDCLEVTSIEAGLPVSKVVEKFSKACYFPFESELHEYLELNHE